MLQKAEIFSVKRTNNKKNTTSETSNTDFCPAGCINCLHLLLHRYLLISEDCCDVQNCPGVSDRGEGATAAGEKEAIVGCDTDGGSNEVKTDLSQPAYAQYQDLYKSGKYFATDFVIKVVGNIACPPFPNQREVELICEPIQNGGSTLKQGGRVHLGPAGETGRKRHDAKARDEANADPATAFAYDAKRARNGDLKMGRLGGDCESFGVSWRPG